MTMGILSDISIDGDRCPNCGRPLHRHYDGYQRRRICDEGCAWYLQAQNECAEIKIRAERKGGELLREMGLSAGRPQKSLHDVRIFPTLSDLGITYIQSHRWQLEASIPDDIFLNYVAEVATK